MHDGVPALYACQVQLALEYHAHPLLIPIVPSPVHATEPRVASLKEHPLPTASSSSVGMLSPGQSGLCMLACQGPCLRTSGTSLLSAFFL